MRKEKSEYIIWLIEDYKESLNSIKKYLEDHEGYLLGTEGEYKLKVEPFIEIESALNKINSHPRPDFICADLYYVPQEKRDTSPREVYEEFMGQGRFEGRGRIEMLGELIKKCGGLGSVVCSSYPTWFGERTDIKKRIAEKMQGSITSALAQIGVKKSEIIHKQRWDDEKQNLLEIIKNDISKK